LRKALDLTGAELAEVLDVRKETVSRWENDQEPMGPHREKLFRLLIGDQLGPLCAVKYQPSEILFMKINPWRSLSEPVHIELVLKDNATECGPATPEPETERWRPATAAAN
jgi:transcriptional regulator with XRE-family HTH domain